MTFIKCTCTFSISNPYVLILHHFSGLALGFSAGQGQGLPCAARIKPPLSQRVFIAMDGCTRLSVLRDSGLARPNQAAECPCLTWRGSMPVALTNISTPAVFAGSSRRRVLSSRRCRRVVHAIDLRVEIRLMTMLKACFAALPTGRPADSGRIISSGLRVCLNS